MWVLGWLGLAGCESGVVGLVDGATCRSAANLQCICPGSPGRVLENCQEPNPFGLVYVNVACVVPTSTIDRDGVPTPGCQFFFQSDDPNFEVTIAETGGAAILAEGERRQVVLETFARGTGITDFRIHEFPPGVDVAIVSVEVSEDCGCGA